jgi:hypothetical protein
MVAPNLEPEIIFKLRAPIDTVNPDAPSET